MSNTASVSCSGKLKILAWNYGQTPYVLCSAGFVCMKSGVFVVVRCIASYREINLIRAVSFKICKVYVETNTR